MQKLCNLKTGLPLCYAPRKDGVSSFLWIATLRSVIANEVRQKDGVSSAVR